MADVFLIHMPKDFTQDAKNICSNAGINLLSKEHIRFVDLAKSLRSSIDLMNQANSDEQFGARAVLALSIVTASCAAFVEIAGTLGELAGIKGTKKAAGLLGVGTKAVDFGIGKFTGQKTDGFGVINAAADTVVGSEYAKKKLGSYKVFAELNMININLVKNAVTGDKKGIKREVFLGFLAKTATMSLDLLKKEAASKMLEAYAGISKTALNYSDSLEKSFDEKISANESVQERIAHRKKLQSQLTFVISQINIINDVISGCQAGTALKPQRDD